MCAVGEIAQVLKARVTDSNKAVQSLALDIVARIATGMGKPFEKQTKFFVTPVATVLADQKAPTRAAGVQTLTAIANACEGMEPLVHGIATALEANNPVQRATLIGWLVEWFKEHEVPPLLDLSSWVASIVGCLDDRSGDVRKGSQGMLPYLIASVGFDKVLAQSNSLKPASKASAVPLINAARASAASSSGTAPTQEQSKPIAPVKAPALPPIVTKPAPSRAAISPPASPTPSPAPPAVVKPASKITGIRRKLPQGSISRPESRQENVEEPPAPVSRMPGKPGLSTGLRRLGAGAVAPKAAPPTPAPAVASSALMLSGMNINAKNARLTKDVGKWVNEAGTTRKDLVDLLQHQMEPHASRDLLANMFSHDHNAVNDHIAGLTMFCDFYSELQAGGEVYGLSPDDARLIGLANSDFALKYVSIKAHEPQSNLVTRCMDVIDTVLAFMQTVDHQLSDAEAQCFAPTLVYKVRRFTAY
jgi:cytoskeleton-associated protein 5